MYYRRLGNSSNCERISVLQCVYRRIQFECSLVFTIVKSGLITFVNMERFSFVNGLWKEYSEFRNDQLSGRYITFSHIEPELRKLDPIIRVEEIGSSASGVPIHAVSLGKGPIRIFGWSQMHGNEATTTRALFDILNLFSRKNKIPEIAEILDRCTLRFIPMLNPDGAERYTRENINGIDLNRDASELTQVESRVLMKCFQDFNPNFCFNLHDQRTIFSAGKLGNPATVSFLAPAMDESRSLNGTRIKAMKTIVAMNSQLQKYIPGQVGRFDDAFNINCSGDRFQTLGVPTILFEAGHFPGDYSRDETRKYIAMALLTGIYAISSGEMEREELEFYNDIPENQKDYCDILLKNVMRNGTLVEVSIQYVEKLANGKIVFDPLVQRIQKELPISGHRIMDCKGQEVLSLSGDPLYENDVVAGILLNRENISFKIE